MGSQAVTQGQGDGTLDQVGGRVSENPSRETSKQDRTEISNLSQLPPSKPGAGEGADSILGFTGSICSNYPALL